jgi:hypothetical protein
MNGGVLRGRPRPGRGCSAIDGWMDDKGNIEARSCNRCCPKKPLIITYSGRLQWSSSSHAGLWFPSSLVQTRPKPLDFFIFLYIKILSMPSFGGEVK